jgi:hypothetical protein
MSLRNRASLGRFFIGEVIFFLLHGYSFPVLLVSRTKKLQAGDSNPHSVTDEIEEDRWMEFPSDPPSDTDEEERDRVAEAEKSKHPTLNAGKHPNDRNTNTTTDILKRKNGCIAL